MFEAGDARLQPLEREVREALATDASTAELAGAPLVVEPGGLSNHAWIAEAESGRYFVRLSPPEAARLGVDRVGECALLRAVAAEGLAPPVVRCDPSRRLLVTRHVDGRVLTRLDALEPARIERLAQALSRLHAMPVPVGTRRVDFAAQASRLEVQCAVGRAVEPSLRARAGSAFEVLARARRAETLCHNDLHHLNLIDAPERLWLVDWEYGGAGDPVFDFASFLCQHDCGVREREMLRISYRGPVEFDAGQFAAACWAFDYVQWLWYRAWPGGEGADPVYAERAAALERRLHGQSPV